MGILGFVGYVATLLGTFRWGGCPDEKISEMVVTDFDIWSYSGLWYDVYHYPVTFQMGCDCIMANYTVQNNWNDNKHSFDTFIRVNNSCFDTEDYEWRGGIGEAVPEDPKVGSLLVTFPESRPFTWLFFNKPNYHVVFLKNYEYALVYSCSNYLGFFGVQNAWFLSRKPEIDGPDLQHLVELVEYLGIDSSKMIKTSHGMCPPMQPWWEEKGNNNWGHETDSYGESHDEGHDGGEEDHNGGHNGDHDENHEDEDHQDHDGGHGSHGEGHEYSDIDHNGDHDEIHEDPEKSHEDENEDHEDEDHEDEDHEDENHEDGNHEDHDEDHDGDANDHLKDEDQDSQRRN